MSVSSTQVPPQTPVTLSASVRNPSPLTATGSVEFLLNGVVFANVQLDSTGAASTTLEAQPMGVYSVSAQYVPSGSWTGSVSGPHTLTVTPPVALALTPNDMSLSAGASAEVSAALSPLSGFSGAMQASCQSSAPFLTCSVEVPGFLAGQVNGMVHLAVAQNTLATAIQRTHGGRWKEGGILALLVPLFLRRRTRIKGKRRNLLALSALALLSGCATGGNFGSIPAGRQLVVVSLTAAGTVTTAGIAVQVTP